MYIVTCTITVIIVNLPDTVSYKGHLLCCKKYRSIPREPITVFTIFCLTADVNDAGQCSITRKGIYTYRDKASECTGTVNIGCTTPNKIIIDTKCKDQFSNAYKEKGKLNNIDLTIICGLSLLYSKTQG